MKKYILIDVFEREMGLPQVFDTEEAAMVAMVDTVAEILGIESGPILQALHENGYHDSDDECEVTTTSAWINTARGNTDIWIIEVACEETRASALEFEKTMIYESCPDCGCENSVFVDCRKEGYKTKCSHCGNDLMLCNACAYDENGNHNNVCDFRWIDRENGIGTCFRRNEPYIQREIKYDDI